MFWRSNSRPHMLAGGAIVNIGSAYAHETSLDVVPYATSKGGMEAFTRGFPPGAVDTPTLWNNPNIKSDLEQIRGAVGKPEDIAAAICYLASDEARFTTGTTLVLDGGRLDILP